MHTNFKRQQHFVQFFVVPLDDFEVICEIILDHIIFLSLVWEVFHNYCIFRFYSSEYDSILFLNIIFLMVLLFSFIW